MTLIRTPSGLANRHLFSGVDVVVYVEGGSGSGGLEVVDAGADDVLFWATVFGAVGCPRSASFVAVGGKGTVRAIAESVIENDLGSVVVAMDRDYDNFCGRILGDRRVLYTYGYAWENDVWSSAVLCELYRALARATQAERDLGDAPRELEESFAAELRWVVTADILFAMAEQPSVQTEYGKVVPRDPLTRRPTLDRRRLRKILRSQPRIPGFKYRLPVGVRVDVLTDCHGHLKSEYYIGMLEYFLRSAGRRGNVDHDDVTGVAIVAFGRLVGEGVLPHLGDAYRVAVLRACA